MDLSSNPCSAQSVVVLFWPMKCDLTLDGQTQKEITDIYKS